MYERIRRHNDIRFPSKKVVSTSDKILLLIQVRIPSSKWAYNLKETVGDPGGPSSQQS